MVTEIQGDLITLAKQGYFNGGAIAHGCNCFCEMGAGIAPQMAKFSGCDKFQLEGKEYKGDIHKLGRIEFNHTWNKDLPIDLYVINCYTQYGFGKNHKGGTDIPLDYDALSLCMTKINHLFKGKHIGLPQIGCGLAGGDWSIVKSIIEKRLKDCEVTIVIYENNTTTRKDNS